MLHDITIYSTKTCPNCEMLKRLLVKNNIGFKEVDMSTPAALTELRMNGVFTMMAPVLQIGGEFFTHKEMFAGEKPDPTRIEGIFRQKKLTGG